ncbi:hypothetical protein LCGC14_2754420, partial [marine sediment metagenome]
ARAASMGISIDEYNSLTPKQRIERATLAGAERAGPELLNENQDMEDAFVKWRSLLTKIRTEVFPGQEVEFEYVDFPRPGFLAIVDGRTQKVFEIPRPTIENIHGQEVAERYSIDGPRALPEDSPLNSPSLGPATLKFLSETADLIDKPRVIGKKKVIEPILPEFEFDVSFAEIAPYVIPHVAVATLMIKGLELATGLDIPELKDVLEKIPGLDTRITVTDNVVAEVMSFVLDPLNLLPVVGFGPEIVKVMRLAARGGPIGVRAALRLAKNPRFLRAADDMLQLAKAEAGFLGVGGRRGQLEARREVLRHIDEGLETTEPALKPVRTEIDNILARADEPARVGIKVKADEIQDALGFGDKIKLRQLGIDPQDIDNPVIFARIQAEAPDIAAKIARVVTEIAEEVPESILRRLIREVDDDLVN